MVGHVRRRGRRAVRGDGGRLGESGGPGDRHRAGVPPPALPTRAGQRPAAAVAARAFAPAHGRTLGLGPHPGRGRRRAGRGLDRRHREPCPRRSDPPHQPDSGGVCVQGRPARGARAAAQRGRVARVGGPGLHRQDRHVDRADAPGGRPGSGRRSARRDVGARSGGIRRRFPVSKRDAKGGRGRRVGGGQSAPRGRAGAVLVAAALERPRPRRHAPRAGRPRTVRDR